MWKDLSRIVEALLLQENMPLWKRTLNCIWAKCDENKNPDGGEVIWGSFLPFNILRTYCCKADIDLSVEITHSNVDDYFDNLDNMDRLLCRLSWDSCDQRFLSNILTR